MPDIVKLGAWGKGLVNNISREVDVGWMPRGMERNFLNIKSFLTHRFWQIVEAKRKTTGVAGLDEDLHYLLVAC